MSLRAPSRPETTHVCPIPTCMAHLPFHLLLCGPHWGLVPKALQQRVNSLWRQSPGSAARQEAIDAVTAQLTHLTQPAFSGASRSETRS